MSDIAQNGQIVIPSAEPSDTQVLQGSIQRLLAQNLGRQVAAEFLVGANRLICRSGTLYAVNADYLVLRDADSGTFMVGDVYALRFITFCQPEGLNETARGDTASPASPRNETESGGETESGEGSVNSGSAANNSGANGADSRQSAAPNSGGRPTTDVRGVTPVMAHARPQAQAALNYAKRKARRLD